MNGGAGRAARREAPGGDGLGWPRGGRRLAPAARDRLLHWERLLGLTHLAVVPLALAATLTGAGGAGRPDPTVAAAIALATALFAGGWHLFLPRLWLGHAKVVAGLGVDTLLVAAVVHLTGGTASVLVFLWYPVVVVGALTLERASVVRLCALVVGSVAAVVLADPRLHGEPTATLTQGILLAASMLLVALAAAAGAVQLQAADRRLLASMAAHDAAARENTALTQDLAARLEESRALGASLAAQREQTQRLAEMVLRAQEEERRRVSRELHDEANQVLAAVMTTVDLAEAQAESSADPRLVATIARLRRLTATALADLQRLAVELRPPSLDEFGLAAALRRHVADRTGGTALTATVAVEGRLRRLPSAVEGALYRIAQEALANAQKHSGAGRVQLRLRPVPGGVRLDISDDGRGLPDGAAGAHGHGIAGMRERAAILGGELLVSSRPGGGTRISVAVPVAAAAVDDAGGTEVA